MADEKQNEWYPTLRGLVHPEAERAIRLILDQVYSAGRFIRDIAETRPTREEVTKKLVSPAVIQGVLQAPGSAPLNVNNLPGVLAQPQKTFLPLVTSLPIAADPLSQDGTLIRYNGTVWYFDGTVEPGTWRPLPVVGVVLQDTFAKMKNGTDYPPANYPIGAVFKPTDIGYQVEYINSGSAWLYMTGQIHVTQANFAALAAQLGANDTYLLVAVTDYLHILQWGGAATTYAPGDPGSGYSVIGEPDGSAPEGGLWGICDGTAYNCLQGSGSLSSKTSYNLTGDVFLKGAAAAGGQQAAVRAKWEAAAKTDNAVTGITINAAATGITVDPHPTAADTAVTGAGTRVTAGTHVVNDPSHSHGITEPNAGAGSSHPLSDANAQLKVPSEANGGLPLRISVVWFLRR
jgi:hypothetical protein